MKFSLKSIVLLSVMMLFCSCHDEIVPGRHEMDQRVNITAEIVDGPATRVSEDGMYFLDNDALMVQNMSRSDNNMALFIYSISEGIWNTEDELLWEGLGENVFHAWYPASASYSSFVIPADQSHGISEADWMTAAATAKISDGEVNLSFVHNLAKIIVNVESWGNEFAEDERKVSSIELNSLSTLMSQDDVLSGDGESQCVETCCLNPDKTFHAVVAPGEYHAGDNVMQVYVGGSSIPLAVTTDSDFAIESGNAYNFKLYIGKDCITFAKAVSVAPWSDETLDGQDILFEKEDNAINLSPDGQTANCYIVSEAGKYKFQAVKGNGKESVGDIQSVEVLWETYNTYNTPKVGALISAVSYDDGKIYFETPELFKKGNAVIAAKDESGKILWSWHIWMVDERIVQHYYKESGQVMMDRNLGSLSAVPGDPLSLGLYYQWGRKDPFLGTSRIDNYIEARSTGSWPNAVYSNAEVGTIEYSIQNPTTYIFYGTTSPYNYDWFYTGTASCDNTRWTSDKTIYDPCPAGWRVPDGGPAGVWAMSGIPNGYDPDAQSDYDVVYDLTNKGKLLHHSNPPAWYPSCGYMTRSGGYSVGGTKMNALGTNGYYWSCTPYGQNRNAYYFQFSETYTYSREYSYYRSDGYNVRCQKIKEGTGSGEVNIPEVITGDVLDVTESGAKVSVDIVGDGGGEVIEKGVIWSLNPDPVVTLATKTSDGYGNDSFVSTITGLRLNTRYYVRAYAINSAGVSYGDTKTIDLKPVDFSNARSLGNPANCYIVPSSGTYTFKCQKNNSTSISNVYDIKVVWECATYITTTDVGDLIKYATYDNGDVKFITNSQYREGNALVAAVDAEGKILWSWHLWMVSDAIVEHKYSSKGYLMDRNLGAVSSTPGDVGAHGLYYQWGRKDPFVGSSSTSSYIQKTTTNNDRWNVVKSDANTGTFDYAISHPMTFLEQGANYDWYYTTSGTGEQRRWYTTKTIYDPCPDGWKVCDGGYTNNTRGVWGHFPVGDNVVGLQYDSRNHGVTVPATYVTPAAWYPMSGYITGFYLEDYVTEVGEEFRVWSNLVYPDSYSNKTMCILSYYESSSGGLSGSQARIAPYYGCSVRCQKQ